MVEQAIGIEAIRADIDALRERFPKTADLYREACAIMFFRYGITPTTTALYQLVRKGSMSVPSEALRSFWDDLRKQSRVDLDSAGLPDELRESAGKLLGQVWSSAKRTAEESIAHVKARLADERDGFLAAKEQADEQAAALMSRLEQASEAIAAKDRGILELREQLSASRATAQKVESQLAEAQTEVDRLQRDAVATSREHAADIDKVTARIIQAEQRYVELEKRMLVELDRERTAGMKLQKSLENERRTAAAKHDKLQSDAQAAYVQIARQEQLLAVQITEIDALRAERDAAMDRAASEREATADLATQLAAEQARVQELREQLRQLAKRSPSDVKRDQQPARPRKRRRDKPGGEK